MTHRHLSSIGLCVILAAAFAGEARSQTTLRWKFRPGETLNHILTQDSTTSMNLGGQMIETKVSMTVDSVWSINKVDDQGNAEITQTTPRLRMKMVSPLMGTTEVDTADEGADSNQLVKALKSLTGAKFTFLMSPRGEISNVKAEEGADNAGPAGGPFAAMLGKDGMATLIKQTAHILPAEPVREGTDWQQKIDIEVPMVGKMTADTTLTYNGREEVEGKPLEAIQVETKTSIGQSAAKNAPQLSITEQSDKGMMYFDNAAGRFSHSEGVQTMTMQVSVGGQTVQQSVTTTRKARLSPAAQP